MKVFSVPAGLGMTRPFVLASMISRDPPLARAVKSCCCYFRPRCW